MATKSRRGRPPGAVSERRPVRLNLSPAEEAEMRRYIGEHGMAGSELITRCVRYWMKGDAEMRMRIIREGSVAWEG